MFVPADARFGAKLELATSEMCLWTPEMKRVDLVAKLLVANFMPHEITHTGRTGKINGALRRSSCQSDLCA